MKSIRNNYWVHDKGNDIYNLVTPETHIYTDNQGLEVKMKEANKIIASFRKVLK